MSDKNNLSKIIKPSGQYLPPKSNNERSTPTSKERNFSNESKKSFNPSSPVPPKK